MEALRCKNCGDTRWSLMGFTSPEEQRCEICGGEMVPERRLPNQGRRRFGVERRAGGPSSSSLRIPPPEPTTESPRRGT
jgi:hypothetical protein